MYYFSEPEFPEKEKSGYKQYHDAAYRCKKCRLVESKYGFGIQCRLVKDFFSKNVILASSPGPFSTSTAPGQATEKGRNFHRKLTARWQVPGLAPLRRAGLRIDVERGLG